MPQIFDPVIDALSGLTKQDPSDFGETQTLQLWRNDPTRPPGRAPAAVGVSSGTFDPSGWATDFENGRIPTTAMVQVPELGQGDAPGSWMRPDAAAALTAMLQAAREDGVNIDGSGYRTYEGQADAYYNPTNSLPHAAPGTSNHGWGIAVDLGTNPWLIENAGRFGFTRPYADDPPHWQYGTVDSVPSTDVSYTAEQGTRLQGRERPSGPMAPPAPEDLTYAPLGLTGGRQYDAYPLVVSSLLAAPVVPKGSRTTAAQTFKGPQAEVQRQLYQGFMDAGREDLAKLVNTRDFQTWVAAESGWNPNNVSQYYTVNGNRAVNGGLFQFRWFDERNWLTSYFTNGNDPSSSFTASPYEQAVFVSKYFNLSAADVHAYAAQVRSGTYGGWG